MNTFRKSMQRICDRGEEKKGCDDDEEGKDDDEEFTEPPPPCDIEATCTYSIHLQLDACVGIGVTKKDVNHVFDKESGVLYFYLNGLKLRAGDKEKKREGGKKEGVEGVQKAKSGLLNRMVTFGKKKVGL